MSLCVPEVERITEDHLEKAGPGGPNVHLVQVHDVSVDQCRAGYRAEPGDRIDVVHSE